MRSKYPSVVDTYDVYTYVAAISPFDIAIRFYYISTSFTHGEYPIRVVSRMYGGIWIFSWNVVTTRAP